MSLKTTKVKKVEKRDGRIVDFDQERISKAILAAGQATGEFNLKTAQKISNQVVENINKVFAKRKTPPLVEQIQDIVEISLMKANFTRSARSYIIYRQEHQRVREEREAILSSHQTDLPLSLNSLKILAGRYLQKDVARNIILESPEEMFQRVAKAIAQVEKKYNKSAGQIKKFQDKFYEIMSNLDFLPAGRTLTNAGTGMPIVSNCIVLHIPDSMDGIFKTLHDATLLQQAGSGLGFPFSDLRPAGFVTKRTQGIASGPISFLKVYDKAFGVVKQQGRHGANMAVMSVDHPDILDFIHIKDREGELANFNISVALTDEFIKKVISESEEPWVCRFKNIKTLPRKITRDTEGNVSQIQEIKITPKEIMGEIAEAAWTNGEPGIIFIDEVNRTNPLPELGEIKASNPCGEQFLHDGDVCNLGSINLANFVQDGKINWSKLEDVTKAAVRMLDNVVDITKFPVERVEKVFRNNRRIGLGVMGFADMLFQLKVAYNSKEGTEVAEKVMKFIKKVSHATSQDLAREKGSFPNINLSIWAKKKNFKIRNAAVTCIAPTGTISMIPEVSSSIEPYFALSYKKQQIMGGQQFHYINHYLEDELKKEGLYSPKIINKIYQTGSIQDIKEIPQRIKKVFVGAMDITPADHVKMQVAFQKHTDNSISKTVNLPNESTRFDVEKIVKLAWKIKSKSFTVYRSGSREKEVLQTLSANTKKEEGNALPPHYTKCPDCGA